MYIWVLRLQVYTIICPLSSLKDHSSTPKLSRGWERLNIFLQSSTDMVSPMRKWKSSKSWCFYFDIKQSLHTRNCSQGRIHQLIISYMCDVSSTCPSPDISTLGSSFWLIFCTCVSVQHPELNFYFGMYFTSVYLEINQSKKVHICLTLTCLSVFRIGVSVKQQFTEEEIYKDRDSQISAIEKTFEDAQKSVTEHITFHLLCIKQRAAWNGHLFQTEYGKTKWVCSSFDGG